MKLHLIKRENASDLILIVMLTALITVLVTRFFLQLFGWPTISFGVWHIAHVNFGGILMIIGIILMLSTHGEKIRRISAAFSGIGWGLFVDEIGKYLTKNNNYWFQPAIIFIYISFIILYLVYRYFEKSQPQDPKTLLYAVISKLEDIAEGDLDVDERKEVLKKLNKIIKVETDSNKKQFALDLKTFIEKQKANPVKKISVWRQMLEKTGYYSYNQIFKRKFVLTFLGIYSGGWAINKIQETVRILTNPQKIQLIQKFYDDYTFINRADIYMIVLKIISDFLVAVLFLIGLYNVATKKRNKGLRFFQLGLIVSIFLSSVFKFYFEQFSEVFVLFTSIIFLIAISKMRKELSA